MALSLKQSQAVLALFLREMQFFPLGFLSKAKAQSCCWSEYWGLSWITAACPSIFWAGRWALGFEQILHCRFVFLPETRTSGSGLIYFRLALTLEFDGSGTELAKCTNSVALILFQQRKMHLKIDANLKIIFQGLLSAKSNLWPSILSIFLAEIGF